jgi:hypothetical protein
MIEYGIPEDRDVRTSEAQVPVNVDGANSFKSTLYNGRVIFTVL